MLTLLGALNSNLPGDEVSLLFFRSQNISHLRSFKNAPWCHQGFPDSLTPVAFSGTFREAYLATYLAPDLILQFPAGDTE